MGHQEINQEINRKRDYNRHARSADQRAQLFDKFAAYELAFAYLLFESFGRHSCVTLSTGRREDPRRSRRSSGQRRTRFTLHRHL